MRRHQNMVWQLAAPLESKYGWGIGPVNFEHFQVAADFLESFMSLFEGQHWWLWRCLSSSGFNSICAVIDEVLSYLLLPQKKGILSPITDVNRGDLVWSECHSSLECLQVKWTDWNQQATSMKWGEFTALMLRSRYWPAVCWNQGLDCAQHLPTRAVEERRL